MTPVDTLTIEILRTNDRGYVISTHVAEAVMRDVYGPRIIEAFARGVEQTLEKQWIERYGEQILNELAPGVIAEALRKRISERVLTMMQGNKL